MKKSVVRLTVAAAIIAVGIAGLQAAGSGQAKPSDAITANRFS